MYIEQAGVKARVHSWLFDMSGLKFRAWTHYKTGDSMALIDCPACGKKMSDKAKSCSHCDFAYQDASIEDIERKHSMQR